MIDNITFQISMPKNFDAAKLGFSSGAVGSTANDRVSYEVRNHLITGSFDGSLLPGEALTVRMELPEGYFVGAGHESGPARWAVFVVPALCLLISFLLWLNYGKNDPIVDTVEFYPPHNLNSLEVGYFYKGKADQKDVVSLLIDLANKGYIKISESQDKTLFYKSKGFEIIRLKDYDDRKPAERNFLSGLFRHGSKGKVSSTELNDKFYVTINSILKIMNSKENKAKVFENTPFFIRFSIIIMLILSLLLAVGIPTMQYAGVAELLITGFIILFYIPFYAATFFARMPKIKKFESIALQAPSWYDSPDSFSTRSFRTFMNNTMTSAQRSMTSSPGSSGGGSSGGGSSGGGGGGGSW